MGPSSTFVVTTRPDRIANDLAAQLAEHPRIQLKRAAPATPTEAAALLAEDPGITVVLLACLEAEIVATLGGLRQARPGLAVVCVPIDGGVTSVTLPDPSRIEVIEIISTLLNLDTAQLDEPGKLLVFPSRGKTGTRAVTTRPEPAREQIVALFGAALDWADAATGALLDLWNVDADATPGFTLTWDSLTSWMKRFVRIAHAPTSHADRAYQAFEAALNAPVAGTLPLARIAELLDRDPLAIKLLLIVLAPELDIRFHRLFGAMHDDLGRRQPSIALACAILAAAIAGALPFEIRVALAGLERLRALKLIEGFDGPLAGADAPLRIEPAVLDWMLSGDDRSLTSAPAARALLQPEAEEVGQLLTADRRATVAAAVRRATAGRSYAALLLTGSEPGWLRAEAATLADHPLCLSIGAHSDAAALAAAVHAARLTDRRLIISLDDERSAHWGDILALCADLAEPPIIIADNAARLLAAAPAQPLTVVELPPPTNDDRRAAVAMAIASLPGGAVDERLAAELADRFRLPVDRMLDAVTLARATAADAHRTLPDAADWRAGFRHASGAHLPSLARRLEPLPCPDPGDAASCLDRVILPRAQKDQLLAILSHVRFGRRVLDEWGFGTLLNARGVSALFSGASGTGKTLAAQAIASALGADLYVVDLARIVSKYIGETEKNLDTVFDEAERAGAVLLFDEADALFGKRSSVRDAHDRYANIEVAYLLQRMELFDGLAILTTNHPENIDQAFTRRLRFSVDFPKPDAAARRAIWELSIPCGPHRDPALDLSVFARRLNITGGSIRQIALHAAMAAAGNDGPIAQGHVQAATRSELVRLGAFTELNAIDERAA